MFRMLRKALASAIFLPVLASASPGSPVEALKNDTIQLARNAIHGEFWGVSSIFSLNYERILLRGRMCSLSGRAGIGSIHLRDFTRRVNPDIIAPFGAYFCLGRKAQAEFGGGGAITSIVYPDVYTYDPERKQRLHGWFSAGVRAGEPAGRLFARAALNCILEFGRMEWTAGVGLGFRF